MPSAESSVDIDAPSSRVMAVITDFASYPSFLPDMQAVDVLRADPGDWEVRFLLRVIRPLSYTLNLVQTGPLRLDWSLVEGAFRSNDGGWVLEDLDQGRTRATYRIDLQVGMFVPANIVRSLVEHSLPDTLARFKAEIEARG